MYTNEQFTKDFKKILIDNNYNVKQFAAVLGKAQATLQKQVAGATFRYVDFVNILDMLGYEVIWRKKGHNAISENDWGMKNPNDEKA